MAAGVWVCMYIYIDIFNHQPLRCGHEKKQTYVEYLGYRHIKGGIWECTNKAKTNIIEISSIEHG